MGRPRAAEGRLHLLPPGHAKRQATIPRNVDADTVPDIAWSAAGYPSTGCGGLWRGERLGPRGQVGIGTGSTNLLQTGKLTLLLPCSFPPCIY